MLRSAFMDVYNSMAPVMNGFIPNNTLLQVNTHDAYLKPLPDSTAPKVMKAIDKMIVIDGRQDGNLLQAAAEAHHKAFSRVDAMSETSAADYEAMNTDIGCIAASVPKLAFTVVCNSMASVVNSTFPFNMFHTVYPLAAYLKPLPDTATSRVMQAIDLMFVMGSKTKPQ